MSKRKISGITIALVSIFAIALLVQWFSPKDVPLTESKSVDFTSAPQANVMPIPSVEERSESEHALRKMQEKYFNEAVVMLHARQYEYAVTALHELLQIAPQMPEAHTNMGFALLGLERYVAARDFFNTALELNVNQINAYYGLALAEEQLGNLGVSLASMETYVHRSSDKDPYLGKARGKIALWRDEIEAQRKNDKTAGTSRDSGSASHTETGSLVSD